METVKLGILGMGTVASGLVKIIELNNSKISDSIGKKLCVEKVLVRNPNKKRNLGLPQNIYTTDAYEIINDPDIQIIVELIGGIDPAREYIKAALKNKKHIVTANKALIAACGEELEELAAINGAKLMYEASVAGGIPIINTISENLAANEFDQITGIVNGTTNYILTQMTENGLEYEQALKEAQRLGFAESDPSLDVEGDDAVYKIAILASIAFGQEIKIKDIPKEGITKISREDINYARELDYRIKLLASAVKKGNEIEIGVHPTFIPAKHPLSTVKNEFNAVFLKGNAVGELMFYGKGAGSLPTGSAILGDIISILKGGKTGCQKFKKIGKYKITYNAFKPYYIRFEVIDKPGVLGKIADAFGANGISLASVMQRQKNGDNIAPLVFITHAAYRKNIDAALKEINKFECVAKIADIIMVENFE